MDTKKVWFPEKTEGSAVEIVNAKQLAEWNAIGSRRHQDLLATNALKRDA